MREKVRGRTMLVLTDAKAVVTYQGSAMKTCLGSPKIDIFFICPSCPARQAGSDGSKKLKDQPPDPKLFLDYSLETI